jgi:hypothetical protein
MSGFRAAENETNPVSSFPKDCLASLKRRLPYSSSMAALGIKGVAQPSKETALD